MSKFVKIIVASLVIVVISSGAGYWYSLGMAVDSLKENFERENAQTMAMVKASVGSIKCEEYFADKEDESEILCRSTLNSLLEAIFKEGMNVAYRANNGSAFFSRENASKMGEIDPTLIAFANIETSSLESEILYTDFDGIREPNGKLMITQEPIHIYKALEKIKSDLIELFIAIAGGALLSMIVLSFLICATKPHDKTLAEEQPLADYDA